MWFNNSSHYYDNPIRGNYAFMTMMHETGHAMGLKHPQDTIGSFGAMPLDHDSIEYTVMSYRSYIGSGISGYTVASSSYPQSLMMFDIQALQTLYGANYTTNSGDTVYSWSPTTGQEYINGVSQGAVAGNKIFLTIWDGGGNDTYDFSNYTTNLNVNLNPGAWTTVSTTQLASLGSGHYAAGNIANALLFQGNTASLIENAKGGSGNDSIMGNAADNHLTGGGGNDTLDGGSGGNDTAVYSGLSTDYKWSENADGSWTIADQRSGSPDGTDMLIHIENLQFADKTVTIGTPPPPPPPPPPTTNTAPVITSAAPNVSLTEWTAGSTNAVQNVAHTASGTMTYSDPDTTDTHVASFAAEASGYVGTFTLGAANDTTDTVGWSFQVADSAISYLTAGQSLTQKYDVTINDGHGGTAMQTVTIVLNGLNQTTTTTTTTNTKVHGNTKGHGQGVLGAIASGNGHGNDPSTGSGNNPFDESAQRDNAPAPSPNDHFVFNGASADTVPHIGVQALTLPDNASGPAHAADLVHLPDLIALDLHIDTTGHGLLH
jgi:serralysin